MSYATELLAKQKLVLRADSGLTLGNIYPLKSERSILGRSVDVAIPVDDSRVSRHHAAVDFHQGRVLLVDLGSTNGTFLNGVRVEQTLSLKLGDRVRLGSTVFVLEALDHAKQGIGKTWREATKAIVRAELESPAAESDGAGLVGGDAERPGLRALARAFADAGSAIARRLAPKNFSLAKHGRLVVYATSGALVAAAVASSFL